MLIPPAAMVFDLDPSGEAELALLQLDFVVLALLVLAHGPAVGGDLCCGASVRIDGEEVGHKSRKGDRGCVVDAISSQAKCEKDFVMFIGRERGRWCDASIW